MPETRQIQTLVEIKNMQSLKTHFATTRYNRPFKIACGMNLLATNNAVGLDYTTDKDKTTCRRCLNVLNPVEKTIVKTSKPKIWLDYWNENTWKTTSSKKDFLYDAGGDKNALKRLEAGEMVTIPLLTFQGETNNRRYIMSVEKPN